MPGNTALYIHIPFCRRKCPYCSFVSFDSREKAIPEYLRALKQEMAAKASGERIGSIYFGGGTPSLVPAEQLGEIISTAQSLWPVDGSAEITMEANPGTVDREYLSTVRKTGVNRLSLGIQSLDEKELALLGRIHTVAEAREAVHKARKAGFDNINLDLMYGLPGQTADNWRNTIREVLRMEPEHLSLYALTLEEETPMWQAIQAGRLENPDPDTSADLYEIAEELLADAGYHHYEISNWSLPGRECRHNLTYWRNEPYIGLGVAAHSSLNGHRLANTSDLDRYLAGFSWNTVLQPEMDEEISPETALAESLILGLRLDAGVDPADLNERFKVDILKQFEQPIAEMEQTGLLEQSGSQIRLTRRGRLLSNEVFWRLLPE